MSNDHDINTTSVSVSVAIGDIKVQFNGSAGSVDNLLLHLYRSKFLL